MKISWNQGETASNMRSVDYKDFTTFCKAIHTRTQKQQGREKRDPNNQYFIRGEADHRNDDNLKEAHILVLDFDKADKVDTPDKASDLLDNLSINHFIYTSSSHTKKAPCYRVLVPYFLENKSKCKRATHFLLELLGKPSGFDPSSYKWSQPWYLSTKEPSYFGTFDKGALIIPDSYVYEDIAPISDVTKPVIAKQTNKMIANIMSGEGYHEESMNIIQQFAYCGTDKHLIDLVYDLMLQVSPRSDPSHSKHSHHKIEVDQKDYNIERALANAVRTLDHSPNVKKTDLPDFKSDFVKEWPEPWPMIFKNFEDCIYHVIPEIYVPACFIFHGVLLGGIFKTIRGRGVNLNVQIASASGVGKDSNTSEPIDLISQAIIDKVGKGNIINNLSVPIMDSVTADTTYLKVLKRDENEYGGLILNTEGSGHWDMVASADNSHTEGVMRIEINMWDGMNITGKVVGKNTFNSIKRPNFSVLRLQQTEALEKNLTNRMVDIGLANRIDYFADNVSRPEIATTALNKKKVTPNSDYLDFIEGLSSFIEGSKHQQIRVNCGLPNGPIAIFENNILLPMVNKQKVLTRDDFRFLKRIIGSAEKQVTEIVAYVYISKKIKGDPVDDMIVGGVGDLDIILDGTPYEKYVIPLMEYQLKIRQYLVTSVLGTSVASAEDNAINEVWSRIKKKGSTASYKPWCDKGYIVVTDFTQRVKAHKFFKNNVNYKDPQKIQRAITSWAANTGLVTQMIEVNNKRKNCYVPKA